MRLLAFLTFVFLLCAQMAAPAIAQQSSNADEEKHRVFLQARLTVDGPIISDGVEWRIFDTRPSTDGDINELAFASGGAKSFDMAPGEYIVHVAYGHATVARRITVGANKAAEDFTLNAGGLKLSATTSGSLGANKRMLTFEIYEQEVRDTGGRKLVAKNVLADEIVALPAGTYHVVSRYGKLNASVRADLRVRPGKLTEATLQHRAALMSFRLVRTSGGDAVADTAWSILTENGEVIQESNSTFPRMVLAEGNYTAIARHNETIFSQDFRVRAGFNSEVEVIVPN